MTKITSIIIFAFLLNLFGCGERQINNNVLTSEIIDTISDDSLLQAVFYNLAERIPEDYTKEYQTVLDWSKSQQVIYVIWCLEGEVNNGGFNQFYFNSSGQFATILPDAFKLIGANRHADLMIRANAVYKSEHKKITEHQDGTLEGFSKSYENNPLEKFDDEFGELEEKENLQKLQTDYIRKHKSDFVQN